MSFYQAVRPSTQEHIYDRVRMLSYPHNTFPRLIDYIAYLMDDPVLEEWCQNWNAQFTQQLRMSMVLEKIGVRLLEDTIELRLTVRDLNSESTRIPFRLRELLSNPIRLSTQRFQRERYLTDLASCLGEVFLLRPALADYVPFQVRRVVRSEEDLGVVVARTARTQLKTTRAAVYSAIKDELATPNGKVELIKESLFLETADHYFQLRKMT